MEPAFTVRFTTIEQVQRFIDEIRKVPQDVDACHGHYIVDAKSVLGILSLSLGREVELILHSDDLNSIKLLETICDEFK